MLSGEIFGWPQTPLVQRGRPPSQSSLLALLFPVIRSLACSLRPICELHPVQAHHITHLTCDITPVTGALKIASGLDCAYCSGFADRQTDSQTALTTYPACYSQSYRPCSLATVLAFVRPLLSIYAKHLTVEIIATTRASS